MPTSLTLSFDPQVEVTCATDHERALDHLRAVQQLRRDVSAHYAELRAPVLATTRALTRAEREHLDPLRQVEDAIEAAILGYETRTTTETQAAIAASLADPSRPAPEVPPLVREGAHTRTTYLAEVQDKRALVRGIVEGTVPLDAVEPKMPVLNALARASRNEFRLPGCTLATQTRVITRAE